MTKLEFFNHDEELAKEYSYSKGCPQTDSGYHCSCYSEVSPCCQCGEQKAPEKENKL